MSMAVVTSIASFDLARGLEIKPSLHEVIKLQGPVYDYESGMGEDKREKGARPPRVLR